jgi:hypothetical protein
MNMKKQMLFFMSMKCILIYIKFDINVKKEKSWL